MNKLILIIALLLISAGFSVYSLRTANAVQAQGGACTVGMHRCTQTAGGCLIEDCVYGNTWQKFRTTQVACEVTGIAPTCFPSRS